ncbi:hypothetical protein OAJ27_01730 [bacterium]|nr:hypothetical protein [bacterium]
MTTNDVMHTVDPEALLEEYQLFIPIPITLSPLTTEKKDLFITASYGGLNKKDSRNFFANQKETDELNQALNEEIDTRTLYSEHNSYSYKLKNAKDTTQEIKSINDLIHQNNILKIRIQDQYTTIGEFNKHIYLELNTFFLMQTGTYTDIFTLTLYEGKVDDLSPLLLNTSQVNVSISIPKITKISDFEWTQISKESALYNLDFSIHTNIPGKIVFKKKIGPYHIKNILLGTKKLKKSKRGFVYHYKANKKSQSARLTLQLNKPISQKTTYPKLRYKLIED